MKDEYTLQAFEVEDIGRRENYTFVYNPYDQSVELYDTSRKSDKITCKHELKLRYVKDFPFECSSAYEYFTYLYKKSTSFEKDNDIYFIGNVHPIYGYSTDEAGEKDIVSSIKNMDHIKSVLDNKLNDLTISIKDKRVSELIKKYAYFAGGCIASLIKEEEPKDFDIFIDSYEGLKEILEYYINLHNDIFAVNRDHMVKLHENEGKIQIGLSKEFIKSSDDDNKNMYPIVFSERAITFPSNIQLIINNGDAALNVINQFDFVHTMSYYKPITNEFFIKEEAYDTINQNKLIYNIQGNNPIGSSKRLLRFIKRGWDIDNKEHMKILCNVNRIENKQLFFNEMGEYNF